MHTHTLRLCCITLLLQNLTPEVDPGTASYCWSSNQIHLVLRNKKADHMSHYTAKEIVIRAFVFNLSLLKKTLFQKFYYDHWKEKITSSKTIFFLLSWSVSHQCQESCLDHQNHIHSKTENHSWTTTVLLYIYNILKCTEYILNCSNRHWPNIFDH